ncbi:MAG TPA: ATP-binding protein [Candidatus Eisenbacteria bacterium]|nr:ATP-binding protein [Candidatus Eisenbacteria bacterium]
MPQPDANSVSKPARNTSWKKLWGTLSAKILVLLGLSMALVFGVLGYLNIQLHRRHLERAAQAEAARMSSVIVRNTSYYMLRNQRDGLYHIITELANEPGVLRIRIINDQGRISFSSDTSENGRFAGGPFGTNPQAPGFEKSATNPVAGQQAIRTYRLANGERALAVLNPIENAPQCSSAVCHAHPAKTKTLGYLDMSVSLATTEQNVAESRRQVWLYTIFAILGVALVSAGFVRHTLHGPLTELIQGTHRLGAGDLGYQINLGPRQDELTELAESFNTMSRQLQEARNEINAWARTLEERVAQKTRELTGAHEEMSRVERMASIGKLAAVVAHEINNPLAGILTYAKLLKKRAAKEPEVNHENIEMLDLVESESRRCGEIVRNLMTFGRPSAMNYEPSELNGVIDRCVRLVKHQLELKNIELHLNLAKDLSPVRCDPGQIEQVLLALVMNAIDAMPSGGTLTLATRKGAAGSDVQVEVRDDGVGMPPEILKNMFEPFFTTKERGRGLGLGLAISRQIVERHQGHIAVQSEPGRGTSFTITLPMQAKTAIAVAPAAVAR